MMTHGLEPQLTLIIFRQRGAKLVAVKTMMTMRKILTILPQMEKTG